MNANPLIRKFRNDEAVTCFWSALGHPLLVEMVAHWGLFDSVMMDFQHGYWNEATLINGLQVTRGTGTTPLIRVAWNDPARIGRALDLGAMGVMVPMVNSQEEAQAVVRAFRYPPLGERSAGGPRLLMLGEDYFTAANAEILCMVMLETAQAVERAEEILRVPGVDLGFIGPGDLAISLGCYPQKGPAHEQAILKILEAGKKAGKPMGILCLSPEEANRRIEQGFRFIPYQTDSKAFEQSIRSAKGAFDALMAKGSRP